jgi:hypothetical protein
MHKNIILLLMITVVIFSTPFIFSSTGVTIGSPRIAPAGPYKVGDQLTFTVACWAQKDISSIRIVGGVEGQPYIFNHTYKNWVTGIKELITIKWQPSAIGSYVLYIEVDPDNLLGFKEKKTIGVTIEKAGQNVTLYEMPKPPMQPFQQQDKKKDTKFRVVNPGDVKSPDLIVSNVKVNQLWSPAGLSMKAEATIKNIGAADVGPNAKFWVSFTIDKTKYLTANLTGLSMGSEKPADCTFNFPLNTLKDGTHEIEVFVDSSRVIAESDENNNSKALNFTIDNSSVKLPDLIVSNVKVSQSFSTTELTLKAEATIKNIGNGEAGHNVQFWVSFAFDKIKTSATNLIGLSAGSERVADFTFNFPLNTVKEGAHEMLVFVDSSRIIQESDENNNENSVKFDVYSHEGNIVLTDWHFSGAGQPNLVTFSSTTEPLILNMVLKNNGKIPFSGKLLNIGFKNPEAGGTLRTNIPENMQVTIQPNSAQTVQIPKIQPFFFMGLVPQPQENVQVIYNMDYGISGISQSKAFSYNIPDLVVIPERYSVQCPFLADPKMQVYGKIQRNHGDLPDGKTVALKINWQRWIKGGFGKAGEMKTEQKILYFTTPFNQNYFDIDGIEGDSWFTTSGGRVMSICFEVDYQDKIFEINESNNQVCGKLVISNTKDGCTEKNNVSFKVQ